MTGMPPAPVWKASADHVEEDRHNWSGSLRFRPARAFAPESEEEVVSLVTSARADRRTLRPIGSAHSATPIIATDDGLVSLDNLEGVSTHDTSAATATVGSGSRLDSLSDQLVERGLSLPNYGDIATQTIAGVISTGTHGSGKTLPNLSMMLVGGRIVTGRGEVLAFDESSDRDLVQALRVSFGTLGIFTQLKLQLLPAYRLRRREWCAPLREVLPRLDPLADENRNFDFYWYPRSDEVKFRCLNHPDASTDYSAFARAGEDRTGAPHEVIPKHSGLTWRFEEMEYAVPAEAGPACFEAVRARMLQRWRRTVAWRVLYRLIRADDTWLSEAHGRDTVAISLHQNASLPWREFFADIEPIFRDHGGRPHWAKQHSLTARELRPLYPRLDAFNALRRKLDPDGVLMSPWLSSLLEEEA